ncbi:MAG TPA: hypothetical protein VD902_05270 [Symbiobacteriaceae bacterium]|nr:hypothetical protein [Symbiobacteriaceae bacterium]
MHQAKQSDPNILQSLTTEGKPTMRDLAIVAQQMNFEIGTLLNPENWGPFTEEELVNLLHGYFYR